MNPTLPNSKDIAGQRPAGRFWISGLLSAVVLAAFAGVMYGGSDFRRPLEHDELLTLRYYTWAGIHPDGWQRSLSRIDDLEKLSRPGARQFAIGAYCSLGRWPEPNNHVVGSLATDVTMALGRPGVVSARVAALLGAVISGAAMFWLVGWRFGWTAVAPLAVFALVGTPYLLAFGQTVRGYSWMLALQLLLLVALLRVAEQPTSILRGTMAAVVAMLQIFNVVTMALYWVMPVYAGIAWLCPDGAGRAHGMSPEHQPAFRKSLAIQFLAIGAVGLVFLVDRLPYVYSSTQQYGSTFTGLRDFFRQLGQIADMLLPGWGWKSFGVTGIVGLSWTQRGSAARTVAGVALLVASAMLGHFLLAGRMPYARVCGLVLPVLVLGNAALVVRLLSTRASIALKSVGSAVATGFCAALILASPYAGLENPGFTRFTAALADLPESQIPVVVLRDAGLPLSTELYLPRSWESAQEPLPPGSVAEVCVLLKRDPARGWSLPLESKAASSTWDVAQWPHAVRLESEQRYRVVALEGQSLPELPAKGHELNVERALFFWYPDADSVTVSPEPLFAHLASYPVRYLPIQGRYQAKLEVFGRVACVMFVADTAAESSDILKAIRAGEDAFGNRVTCFLPIPVGDPRAVGTESAQ